MSDKHQQIINLITEIRNAHSCMPNIFLQGSCLNFFCILHTIYPDARAWYNSDHIITCIDRKFYDITGCISWKKVQDDGYLPFETYYDKKRSSRAWTQMYKAQYPLLDMTKYNEWLKSQK